MTQAEAFLNEVMPNREEQALALAVHDHPEEPDRLLIYADWLEERGDQRCEFLRTRHALLTAKGKQAKNKRPKKPGPEHPPEWLALIGATMERFRSLQERLEREYDAADQFLHVRNDRGLLDVHYRGNLTLSCDHFYGRQFGALGRLLVSPGIAPVLRSLVLEAHEEHSRANGWINISLPWMAEATFPRMTAFTIPLAQDDAFLGDEAEDGETERILRQCYALESLTIPNSPTAWFFSLDEHPLRELKVAAGGAGHEDFILRLSQSTCFPCLRVLEWEDCTAMYRMGGVPFSHYLALFRAPIMAQLEKITLRRVLLPPDELAQLYAIRSTGVTIHEHDPPRQPRLT